MYKKKQDIEMYRIILKKMYRIKCKRKEERWAKSH